MSEAVEAARGVVEVALNLWWSWEPEAQALFRALEPGVYEGSLHNPVAVLRAVVQNVTEVGVASGASTLTMQVVKLGDRKSVV